MTHAVVKKKPFKKILITAGPTREMLDPVRFLSNLSTGEMGYTLARAARDRGYRVTLISGPTSLKPPQGVRFFSILSARDLQKVCQKEFPRHQALVMTAAVCDFTARTPSPHKIRRTRTKQLHLKQTPDILAGLAGRKGDRIVIGFCLETEHWIRNAREKMKRKRLDGIVANFYRAGHIPFGNRRITTAFLEPGSLEKLERKNKKEISRALLGWVEALARRRKKTLTPEGKIE